MHSSEKPDTLRERTRRAVQSELIDIGLALFSERGFEAVTVDEIAAAAGVSKRSFFRYFAGKDEIVLGKIDRQGDQFVRALADRPLEESAWVALRRMFDDAVRQGGDPERAAHGPELNRVIHSSATLRAAYLERMQGIQRLVIDELDRRESGRGSREWSRVAAPAIVGAAFAALLAAYAHSEADGSSFSDALDEAMDAIARESGREG